MPSRTAHQSGWLERKKERNRFGLVEHFRLRTRWGTVYEGDAVWAIFHSFFPFTIIVGATRVELLYLLGRSIAFLNNGTVSSWWSIHAWSFSGKYCVTDWMADSSAEGKYVLLSGRYVRLRVSMSDWVADIIGWGMVCPTEWPISSAEVKYVRLSGR